MVAVDSNTASAIMIHNQNKAIKDLSRPAKPVSGISWPMTHEITLKSQARHAQLVVPPVTKLPDLVIVKKFTTIVPGVLMAIIKC